MVRGRDGRASRTVPKWLGSSALKWLCRKGHRDDTVLGMSEPELRDGPPWAMEEMIEAEPGLVAPILASPEAVEAAEWIRETETVVVTGWATSARTILITARAEVGTGADLTIGTRLVDKSWCHTVGYVSPLLALTAIAG